MSDCQSRRRVSSGQVTLFFAHGWLPSESLGGSGHGGSVGEETGSAKEDSAPPEDAFTSLLGVMSVSWSHHSPSRASFDIGAAVLSTRRRMLLMRRRRSRRRTCIVSIRHSAKSAKFLRNALSSATVWSLEVASPQFGVSIHHGQCTKDQCVRSCLRSTHTFQPSEKLSLFQVGCSTTSIANWSFR